MTAIKPTIKLFTSDKDNAGIQINSLILEHNGNNYHLQGGTKDTIHVFLQGLGIYVLTINKRLGYMALNSFMVPEPDPINSMFMHNYEDITRTLGKKWVQMKPDTIVQKLIDYLY
jgi:hypothetical protein